MHNPKAHYGDYKYYRSIHVRKQKELGSDPLTYSGFMRRLQLGYNLHDAIYEKRGHLSHVKPVKFDIEDKSRLNANLLEEGINVHDYCRRVTVIEKKRSENRLTKLIKKTFMIWK